MPRTSAHIPRKQHRQFIRWEEEPTEDLRYQVALAGRRLDDYI